MIGFWGLLTPLPLVDKFTHKLRLSTFGSNWLIPLNTMLDNIVYEWPYIEIELVEMINHKDTRKPVELDHSHYSNYFKQKTLYFWHFPKNCQIKFIIYINMNGLIKRPQALIFSDQNKVYFRFQERIRITSFNSSFWLT